MPRRRKRSATPSTPHEDRSPGLPPGSSRGRVLRFALIFVTLVILGSASEIYILRQQQMGDSSLGGAVYAFQTWIADSVGWCLGLTSIPVQVDDTTITVSARRIEVAVECTGIKATAVFWAGVLAFPCTWRARLLGLLTGLIGVGVLNILRIVLLGFAAGYRYAWFDPLHSVLMQGFVIVFVAPLWIVWMLQTVRIKRPSPEPAAVHHNPR